MPVSVVVARTPPTDLAGAHGTSSVVAVATRPARTRAAAGGARRSNKPRANRAAGVHRLSSSTASASSRSRRASSGWPPELFERGACLERAPNPLFLPGFTGGENRRVRSPRVPQPSHPRARPRAPWRARAGPCARVRPLRASCARATRLRSAARGSRVGVRAEVSTASSHASAASTQCPSASSASARRSKSSTARSGCPSLAKSSGAQTEELSAHGGRQLAALFLERFEAHARTRQAAEVKIRVGEVFKSA